MSGINQEDLPKIRKLIVELNHLAQIRKETVDKLWILSKNDHPEQLQACVDKLWSLEDTGESLRSELMRLLNHP